MEYLLKAALFLIDAVFGIYIFLLMLRFLLQWTRIDFYHPMSQFLLMVTSPPLRPLQRLIPNRGSINIAALVLMLLLQILKRSLMIWLIPGVAFHFFSVSLLALADLISLLIYIFIFSIIIQVILSWVPSARNEFSTFLYRLNEPLLGPARRLIKPIHGFDLSPIVVLLGLQLLLILLVGPLNGFGKQLGM